MFNFSNKKEKGFTLVEIITVTGIIALLSSIVFVNYKSMEKNLALQRSASQLARDLRNLAERAMSYQECINCCTSMPSSYGFYTSQPNQSNNTYLFFADCDSDNLYDSGRRKEESFKDISYEKNVYLAAIATTSNSVCSIPGPGQRRVHITFSPPSPKIEINIGHSNPVSCNEIVLELGLEGSTSRKRILINKAGLIDVY